MPERIGWLRVGDGTDGSGKTRLAAELANRVHSQNGVVLYARCDHAHVGPRLLFDAALRSQGSSIADVSVGTDGLAVATAQHLAAWRRDQPVLAVLDDLHLADAATLSAVAELAEWCSSMPVLIVGAFQADQYTVTGDRQLVLGGLDRTAVAAICELYRPDGWTTEAVSRVLAASGGLPLHVHRTAAEVAEQSVIAEVGVAVATMSSAERMATSSRAAATDAVLGLRQLLERRHRHHRSIEPGDEDVNPYRGLARYEEHDAAVFFGRERLVAELLVRLASSDVLAIVGSSGSGKSSLVRAGVLAALADGALPDSRAWQCAVITPGNDPRAELAGVTERTPGPGGRLFVIDQFEELYTVGHPPGVQAEFLDEVDRLAGTPDTRVLIVMRSDQLVRVTEHPAIASRMRDSTIVVGPLTGAEMRSVVTGPAEHAGVTVEPALVDHVVADSAGEAGALPLVSTALAATWERRSGGGLSVSGYHAAGRVSGAIARLADDAWEAMPDVMRAAARLVLLRLVRPDDGAGAEIRVRASPHDVAPTAATAEALGRMVERRLLALGDGTVEITHESLLREWPRLAGWLAEDVEGRRLHHRLTAAAALWERGGCDDGDLMRGVRLAATNEWLSSGHESELNDTERRFIAAAIAGADRELAAAHREARHQSQTNRKLRIRLGAIAVLLAGAIGTGALAVRQAGRADDAAEAAEAASLLADAERLGAQSGLESDLDVSMLLAAQAFSIADTPSTRGALLGAVQRSPEAVRVIRSDASRMLALELSPDGATLAANETLGGTTLYDVASGERIGHYEGINANGALAWTPDGSAFATLNAGASGNDDALDVVIIDATTLDERARYPGRRDPVSDLAFSPDGDLLVAGPADTADVRSPEVTVWEVVHPGAPVRSIEVPDASDRDSDAISFDGSGGQVAVSMNNETAVIDVRTGERTDTFEGSGGAFSPDGRTLVVNSAESEDPDSLVLVDVSSGDRRPLQGAQTSGVRHRDFSRDSSMLATSGNDGLVRIWETTTGREVHTLRGHTGRTLAGVFSPDGATVYSTGLDRAIFSWDLVGRNTLERTIAPPLGPDISSENFTITSDESAAVIAPFGTTLLLPVQLPSGAPGDVIDAGHGIIAMLPSGGTTVIVGTDDLSLSRWDVTTGSLLAEADEESDLYPLAVSPDRSTVFVQVGPDAIQAFDATTLEPRGDLLDVGAPIGYGAISADGDSLAVSTFDPNTVRVLDVETGTQRSVTVPGFVSALAYSPDGGQLAAGDVDGRVLLIDRADASFSGEPAIVHDGLVTSIAYSADGSQFTSASTDGVVLMWEAATGRVIGPVQPGPPDRQARSTWSADGHTLLVMYNSGAVHAFETRPDAWFDYACRTAARHLTETEWELLLPGRPYRPACRSSRRGGDAKAPRRSARFPRATHRCADAGVRG